MFSWNLQYFTAFIPQITQTTLSLIEKSVPEDEWDNIKAKYAEYWYPPTILNVKLLIELIETMAPGEPESDQDDDYYEEWDENGNEEQNEELKILFNILLKNISRWIKSRSFNSNE